MALSYRFTFLLSNLICTLWNNVFVFSGHKTVTYSTWWILMWLASSTVFALQAWLRSLLLHLEKGSDQPGMASRPPIHHRKSAEVLGYWSAASYFSLLDIVLPQLSRRISSNLLHASTRFSSCLLTFQKCSVFTFLETELVPLRNDFKFLPLRFLMWIVVIKGRLRVIGILTHSILMLSMPFSL